MRKQMAGEVTQLGKLRQRQALLGNQFTDSEKPFQQRLSSTLETETFLAMRIPYATSKYCRKSQLLQGKESSP